MDSSLGVNISRVNEQEKKPRISCVFFQVLYTSTSYVEHLSIKSSHARLSLRIIESQKVLKASTKQILYNSSNIMSTCEIFADFLAKHQGRSSFFFWLFFPSPARAQDP